MKRLLLLVVCGVVLVGIGVALLGAIIGREGGLATSLSSWLPFWPGKPAVPLACFDREKIWEVPAFADLRRKVEEEEKTLEKDLLGGKEKLTEEERAAISQQIEDEVKKKEEEWLKPLLARLDSAVARVARARHFSVILDKAIVVSGVTDITPAVLEEYRLVGANHSDRQISGEQAAGAGDFDRLTASRQSGAPLPSLPNQTTVSASDLSAESQDPESQRARPGRGQKQVEDPAKGGVEEFAAVGFVDQEALMKFEEMRSLRSRYQMVVRELEKEFKKEYEMAPPGKREEVLRRHRDLLEQRRTDLLDPVLVKVKEAIKEVAMHESLGLVVEKSHILYGGKNITQQVMKKLTQ